MRGGLDRRAFLKASTAYGVAAVGACSAFPKPKTSSPALAVTVDDFLTRDDPMFSGLQRDENIRMALSDHNLLAGAFPKGAEVANETGRQMLTAWAREGHVIGNHTWSHAYFSGNDPEAAMADVLRAEAELEDYPTYRKWLRFPFLAEGRDMEGRDKMRALMRENGYRNAHVTVDTSDWYVNQRLEARLKKEPAADVSPYREYYLDHLWKRASFYNDLARDVTRREDLPHILLLHHNLTSALFLGDALDMFEQRGWRLVDVETAYGDPIYRAEPDSLPAGQSLIWAKANESGRYEDRLRYPAEDGRYEEDAMDALGL